MDDVRPNPEQLNDAELLDHIHAAKQVIADIDRDVVAVTSKLMSRASVIAAGGGYDLNYDAAVIDQRNLKALRGEWVEWSSRLANEHFRRHGSMPSLN